MSRILKTSGFLGLAVMMAVGLYMAMQLETGGDAGWLVTGHAHLGVLSILAVVVGAQVDVLGVAGRARQTVTGLYVTGQWLLPTAIWVVSATGEPLVGMSTLLWGLCLVLSMLVMAHQAWTSAEAGSGRRGGAVASAD
jgi:hypothetical protein